MNGAELDTAKHKSPGEQRQFSSSRLCLQYMDRYLKMESAIPANLPDWLLRSQLGLLTSRTYLASVESRIDGLGASLVAIEEKIASLGPRRCGEEKSSDGCTTTDTTIKKAENSKILTTSDIPAEVFGLVFQYLTMAQVIDFGICSRIHSTTVSDAYPYWRSIAPLCSGRNQLSHLVPSKWIKIHILSQIRMLTSATSIIETVRRYNSPTKPSSSRKQEHASNRRGKLHQQSTAISLSSSIEESVERLFKITTEIDDSIHCLIVKDFLYVIPALVTLLDSDIGSVQNYSAGILANLLWYEALKLRSESSRSCSHYFNDTLRKIRECIGMESDIDVTFHSLNNNSSSSGMGAEDVLQSDKQRRIYSNSIVDCNGHRKLAALLTSPLACINLASSSSSENHYAPQRGVDSSGSGEASGNLVKVRHTAHVQRICSKNACRALINLLFSAQPVPLPAIPSIPLSFPLVFSSRQQQMQASSISPLLSPVTEPEYINQHNMHGDGRLTTAPCYPFSPLSSSTSTSENGSRSAAVMINTSALHHHHHHQQRPSDFMSSFLLDRRSPQLWTFTYFYKSGALKDSFVMYLKFTRDAVMFGRGHDSLGQFTVTGRASMDIGGWVWHFSKTYASALVLGDIESWLAVASYSATLPIGDLPSSRTSSPHVNHVAYFSDTVDTSNNKNAESFSDMRCYHNITSSVDSVHRFDISRLYGIWEAASTGPHFALQKGGIFRATPLS